jgi:hypothetical protein
MFFRFSIFFLGILFGLNLWASAVFEGYSSWLGIVFSLVVLIAARLVVSKWKFAVLPAVLIPGSVFLLSLIDTEFQAAMFTVFSSVVFYLTVLAGWRLNQYERDETAMAMYNVATIAALFFWYAAAFGWYLNIPVPVWVVLAVFVVVTFFVSAVSLSVNQIEKSRRLLYSLFLSLFVAQSIWLQNFWPFGYLTTSVITLIIYYVSWSAVVAYFQKKLTFRAVVFDVIFLLGSASVILLSTRWYPVV